ncbi:dTDP-4-dehydrorhamnose reductase [Verminephrobacter aporrectodeae]|uniref:dTDP-4-dehydrorhamnose reductase n=1 Tax=Verminephrobacter aporrectodeae TaxID=1110389 RepID=UPI002244AAA3|nr:dTDP-4-dehydrorhamnose reductase [Verminephrobacter aporrectodeae]MCW8177412.1 dTDP-4-dehydrorhamnose reductase [Verminephrobacter aporrectodeae subsp. tuberculatae]MCW8204837.1 dTDP-4-dehydrorhamnose reductase [Verminephrobacter aporrectodeae subsp. tuberculatae]
MNILLFGKGGQIGWELQRSLSVLGQVTALDRGSTGHCGDFADPAGVAAAVRALRPDVIVNAAAYTAVDRAESEPGLARTVNAATPGAIAQEAARLNAWLVHYSSDYVFDGSGTRPWVETDAPAPLSVYGRSKLEGEQLIAQSGARHLILRTSWVYAARGGNFARTMLRLARERERLEVVDDQWGAPTGADLLADVTAHALRQLLQRPQDAGLYHCAAAGETSWNGYAKYVLEQARLAQPALEIRATEVAAVPSHAFPTPAARPHNSRLNTHALQTRFGLSLPPWQQGVARMLAEIL